jgi:hypothetical protein
MQLKFYPTRSPYLKINPLPFFAIIHIENNHRFILEVRGRIIICRPEADGGR